MSKNQQQQQQQLSVTSKCRNCISNRQIFYQNNTNPLNNNNNNNNSTNTLSTCSSSLYSNSSNTSLNNNNLNEESSNSINNINNVNQTGVNNNINNNANISNNSSNLADNNNTFQENNCSTSCNNNLNSNNQSKLDLNECMQSVSNLTKKKNNNFINNSSNHNQSDFYLDQSNAANSLNRNACIIERLNFLYLNDSLADVYFLVGKNNDCVLSKTVSNDDSNFSSKLNCSSLERIPAHKLVLSIGSQVFMAMFYGTGSQMLPTTEIEIPDVDPESFKHMLRYLYTDELNIEPDSVMSTLYVAKKYAIGALERECVDFLKNNLRPDNAFMLLEQALLFDETKLAELCLNLIDKNSCEAFSSDCFLDIELETLILILKRDSLGIREFKLYYYLLKWAQNKCVKQNLLPINRENQKLVLGEAIKLIRFPLMSKEEFAIAMNDFDSRIIDDESIIDLFINLTLTNNGLNSFNSNSSFLPKKLIFNDTPRCCLGGKEQVINRFSQVESRWGYSGTSDRVRFTVNQRIFVVGFGLYGSIYGKCEYQAIIQLIHYDSCKTCAQNSTTFTCDGTNSTFKVYFKEPVEIFSDTDYIASATLKGPDSFYGTKGLRKVSHELPSGGKVTFNFQYASGNNNGTSVEDGQIPEIIFLYSCA